MSTKYQHSQTLYTCRAGIWVVGIKCDGVRNLGY